MKIKDVMTKNVNWISPDTTLVEAAAEMKDQDIGFLPVGENDKLIGSVTDRDIVVRALAKNLDMTKATVKQAMTSKIYYCFEDQSVDEICENMADIKVRRLPVVTRDKKLVGVVSLGDLAQAKEKSGGEALKTITEANNKNNKKAA